MKPHFQEDGAAHTGDLSIWQAEAHGLAEENIKTKHQTHTPIKKQSLNQ